MNDIEKIDERKKKSTKIKLPCGINKNGEVVYVDDVKNGKACECFCPGCHQQLVAKNKGTDKTHHFAHKNKDSDCEHGYQSALHYMAKDLFTEMKELVFIKNGKIEKYKIDSVEIEHRLDSIIPDILVTCDGKQFIVEIFVTHAVDDEKKAKIKQMMIYAIEINVSHLKKENVDKEILRAELSNTENFSWIYDADDDLIEQKKTIIQSYGTKNPIHKNFDAILCLRLINQKEDHLKFVPTGYCMKCNYGVHNIGENFIYCGLHLPIPVKPVAANIFVNENKVMFLSEFQKYNKSFRTNLENAVKKQIAVFNYIRQLNLNLAVQQF